MSNIAVDSDQSAVRPSGKRSVSPVIWLVLLVVAALAFGAAVVWAGGIGGVLEMVGVGSGPDVTAAPSKGSVSTAAAATSTATPSDDSTVSLPVAAQKAMYREQLQSQDNIGKLVDNEVAKITFDAVDQGEKSAAVSVEVEFREGSSLSGVMVFKRYQDAWYFHRITASGNTVDLSTDGPFDESIVAVIAEQQASADSQEMIAQGILEGGYKTAEVTEVTEGAGTKTVHLALSGGSEPDTKGQLLCISKSDGADDYWFLTEFSAE